MEKILEINREKGKIMSIITRKTIKELSLHSVYTLLVLLALYSLFDVLEELDELGEGSYTGFTMLQYILLQMPAHAYELMPLAVLIGALLTLNRLVSNSELTVIKASGVSTQKIISILLSFGMIFAVCTVVLSEWIAPLSTRYATQIRTQAISGNAGLTASGLWLREQQYFINIHEKLPDQTLRGITIYRYNEAFKLQENLYADSASIDADGIWQLNQVKSSTLTAESVTTTHQQQLAMPMQLDRKLLNVLSVQPEQMAMSELGNYIQHLEENKQQTNLYRIAWWRKLVYPLAAMVMALVALAFTPQSARHSNVGVKLFQGIGLGLTFHFASRFFGFSGQLYHLPAPIAALLPTLIFALLAVLLIYQQEKR